MASVGWATLDVIPSVKGIARDLDKQTAGPMAAAGRTGGKRFGDAAGVEASKGFRSRFAGAMRGFNPLAGVAIGAGLVAGFVDLKNQASEAEQAVGGVRAVFGQYAEGVISDSERAAQGLGLSSTAYQELITLSGALLKNKGIEDFAGQARSLVEVGADLAAQFGGPTQEAVDALNSALRGESDPIERYAISLNETAVNAELAKTGMDGLEGAALEQAKTQARLSLIMQQSADAAGAFGRESETAAGKEARATAQLANMRQELGEKLLPAYAGFVGFLNDEGLPALEATGGFAMDAARAFADLPGPVKAAATAFVALRVASATGLTTGLVSGAGRASSAIDTLRLRAMLTADAFRTARSATVGLSQPILGATTGMGRLSASFSAARVGAAGAGTAIKAGLGGAVGMLGGPWGIAIAGGVALLAKFWGEHQEAKQHVAELTDTLNEQTGAITDNTRATVIDRLEKDGLLKSARELGINLGTVTNAALGNKGAMAQLQAQYEATSVDARNYSDEERGSLGLSMERRNELAKLIDALGGESSALSDARAAAERKADADKDSALATEGLRSATAVYRGEIESLRGELQKLIDKEKERALAAIQQRRDNIALKETMAAAREEAAKGRRTLNESTAAGRENMTALLDLADQWTNSTPKVQNARGAYEQMRQKFIEVAIKMGATGKEARKLADDLLAIPKTAPVRFQSEGYRERMREIAAIRDALANLPAGTVLDYTPRGFGAPGYATGGKIGGSGGPTADDRLIAVSSKEWVIRAKAAAYYGDAFMSRLNNMQLPRFANGGPVSEVRQPAAAGAGIAVSIGTVVAHDYNDFMHQTQRKAQQAHLDGVRSGR